MFEENANDELIAFFVLRRTKDCSNETMDCRRSRRKCSNEIGELL